MACCPALTSAAQAAQGIGEHAQERRNVFDRHPQKELGPCLQQVLVARHGRQADPTVVVLVQAVMEAFGNGPFQVPVLWEMFQCVVQVLPANHLQHAVLQQLNGEPGGQAAAEAVRGPDQVPVQPEPGNNLRAPRPVQQVGPYRAFAHKPGVTRRAAGLGQEMIPGIVLLGEDALQPLLQGGIQRVEGMECLPQVLCLTDHAAAPRAGACSIPQRMP
ncbi:hypothetical protein K3G39_19305 [Pontibacter sp. HSC-14F20]|nr:hypothetical protein [Pontibacter sp. HSC-14F20]MBX0335388.1 hypothetical protein [Pontibacter sp. HSC-14F20]